MAVVVVLKEKVTRTEPLAYAGTRWLPVIDTFAGHPGEGGVGYATVSPAIHPEVAECPSHPDAPTGQAACVSSVLLATAVQVDEFKLTVQPCGAQKWSDRSENVCW